MGLKAREILFLILIAAAGLLAYSNSLSGDFLWDDILLVRDNAYIKDISYVPKLFTQDIGAGAESEYNFYRPLQMLSYMLDYAFFGLDSFAFHLTNVILHILVAIAVYFLILILFKDSLVAFGTALLFVVHPINTEAVTYISGRADPLAALFVLICFIAYIRNAEKSRASYFFLCLVSYILALLSREHVLVFPLVLLFYHYVFEKKVDRRIFGSLSLIALLYIVVRLTFLRGLLSDISEHPFTFLQRVPGSLAALVQYCKLFILPFELHMEYGDVLFSFKDVQVVLGLVIVVFSLAYLLRKKRNALVAFAIGWFFIWFAPHSNLYPLSAYMAEHWMYLSSIGFFLLLASLFGAVFRSKFKIAGLIAFIALIGFFVSLTLKQNTFWLTPDVFYRRTLGYAAQSPRMYYNLARSLYERGRVAEAIASYQKAIEVDPAYAKAYYNLGIAYYHVGEADRAIEAFYKAVEVDPKYVKAYYNLGNALSDRGRNREAIEAYEKAIENDPGYTKAYNNVSIVYYGLGRMDEAVAVLKKAPESKNEYPETHYNLANALSALGRKDEAIAEYEEALQLKPDYADAYNNLGITYYDIQRFDKAIDSYNKALRIRPHDPDLYNNLGNAYRAKADIDQAIDAYRKAIEEDPGYAMAYNNLAVSYYYTQKYDLAIEYVDRALELGYPVHPEFLKLLEPHRE